MEPDFRTRLLEWFTHALKVLSALGICICFVLLLMLAIAQQQVITQMSSQGLRGNYDSALMMRENVDAKTLAGTALTAEDEKVAQAFSGMDLLMRALGPHGGMIVYLSPPLLQLLLTFVSGLFGALLVTLVLIVYPGNGILSVGDARPATRTFLGGLIALCVYIVLLGGTAVLGSQTGGDGAGSNNMAFAGIGILAGMFSDRVAGWLSKRADEFFKQ